MTSLHSKWASYSPLLLAATLCLALPVHGNPLRAYCEDGLTRSGGKTLLRDVAVFGIKGCDDLKSFDYSKLDRLDAKTQQDYDYAIEMLKSLHLFNTMPRAEVDELVPHVPSPEDLAAEQKKEREKCIQLIKAQDKKKPPAIPPQKATKLDTGSRNPYFASCLNKSGQTIGVYGPPHASSRLPNALYLLKPGFKTPKGWECRGFFLPSDMHFSDKAKIRRGPMALERGDFWHDVVITHSNDNLLLSRSAIENFFKPGARYWPIPDKASTSLAGR